MIRILLVVALGSVFAYVGIVLPLLFGLRLYAIDRGYDLQAVIEGHF